MNSHIRRMNKALCFVGSQVASPVSCWKWLAVLQATLSIWLVQASQHNPSLTLLGVVVWGGAVICIEDQLDELQLKPSRVSFALGTILLLIATVRSVLVLDQERIVLILPLLQGVALALLLRPIRQLSTLRQPLIVLSLFPLQDLATRLLPSYWLSVLNAKIGQAYLLLFSLDASSSGRFLLLEGRGVEILKECNGVDLMAQLTTIAIVFALAFPIRSLRLRMGFIALAPLLAVLVNAGRIAILALVVSSTLDKSDELFTFLHEKWGSLVFAGIATVILGQLYLTLIDRELRRRHG